MKVQGGMISEVFKKYKKFRKEMGKVMSTTFKESKKGDTLKLTLDNGGSGGSETNMRKIQEHN